MNTKVEEALSSMKDIGELLLNDDYPATSEELDEARTTLAAHIAQQDATIARLTGTLLSIQSICEWERTQLAALNQEQVK